MNILLAFSLTLIAGLSTGIGSAISFFATKTNTKFLSFSLGFSAGVMIYVSMIEIFQQAQKSLTIGLGEKLGGWATAGSFFLGIFLIAIIDKLIPSYENPHEINPHPNDEKEVESLKKINLKRMGLLTALAIGIHNFPEGMATFISALQEPTIAIGVTIAIAIHNIPEGIAVSIPIYYATGNKKKAFLYSFLSGLAEPLGAIIGFLILMPFLSDTLYGIIFGSIAGIMIFISLDELLPAAREYGEHHISIYGLVIGMIVMAISLLLF